jgi:hypothetical protein
VAPALKLIASHKYFSLSDEPTIGEH